MFKQEEIIEIYNSINKIEKFKEELKKYLKPIMPSILESLGHGEYYWYRDFYIGDEPIRLNKNNELEISLEFSTNCGDTDYIYIPCDFLCNEKFIEEQKKKTEELRKKQEEEKIKKEKLFKEKKEKEEYERYLKLKEKYGKSE